MGKRSNQGASLRTKKRADETYADFEQALTEQAEQDRVQSTKDDELFIFDTDRKEASASSRAARRARYREKLLNANAGNKKGKSEPSDKDLRQIQKLLQNHGEVGAIALAQRGKARMEQKRQERRMAGMTPKSGKPTYDLWDQTNAQPKKKAKLIAVPTGKLALGGTAPVEIVSVADPLPMPTVDPMFDAPAQPAPILSNKQLKARKYAQLVAPPTVALEVAHPGQSYRPDKEQHQDAIGEALSIEIRRNEAEEYKATPISTGLSAFTQSYIIRESDSEEDSSDDEEEHNDNSTHGGVNAKLIKRKDKLTRAQRNKQKRIKAEQIALLQRKQTKQFMHQISEIQKHSKAVKVAEMLQQARQQELTQLKEEKKARPLGKDLWNAVSQQDPLHAPSLPVALTEELEGKSGGGGSLRTVTPKGSLVTDRLESMAARNMICKKKLEGRRIVQGKRRKKVVDEKGTEYLLM
ncbi:hypothetical protein ACHAW6_008804 [Cyclotella cf. meneghiniana]